VKSALLLAAALGACSTDLRLFEGAVAARAPRDLACSAGDTRVQRTTDWSYEATGCGRHASYQCVCMENTFGKCTRPDCTVKSSLAPSTP
jgi:hypothetical protein